MNHHDMVCLDAFKRVKDFGTTHTADFAAKTFKKVGLNVATTTKSQALFTELTDFMTGLTDAAASQVGGMARSGTKLKNGQQQQWLGTMRRIYKSAAAIASAQTKPESHIERTNHASKAPAPAPAPASQTTPAKA